VKRPATPFIVAALVALSAVGLAVLSRQWPGVRHVDFIQFSGRARALLGGERLFDGLYPLGYPAVLAAVTGVTGDALWAGKALAALAGAGLCGAVARWLGAPAALWLGAQVAFQQWACTEGTDLPAAAASIAAVLAAADKRPALAGALCGLGCMMRYTGVAAVPVVLALCWERRAIVALLATVSPHFLGALWEGKWPWPRQEMNLAIGAAAAAPGQGALGNYVETAWRAFGLAFPDWASRVAVVGFLPALGRKDRRAIGLVAFAVLHVLLISIAFANPRVILPAHLALVLGGTWLVVDGLGWVAVQVVCVTVFGMQNVQGQLSREERPDPVLGFDAALPEGAWAANNARFYSRDGPWLVPAAQVDGLGLPPGAGVEIIRRALLREGLDYLAVDSASHRQFPVLARPLPEPVGFQVIARSGYWTAYRVRADSPAPPTPR
jgi:hypothetical protein